MVRSHVVLWLVLVGVVGCGSGLKTHPVRGKVTFSDGQVIPGGGRIELRSEAAETRGLNARGDIDAQGNYSVSTWQDGKEYPGAVAGPHKVTLFPLDSTTPGNLSQEPPPSPLPFRYRTYEQSGLEITVEPEKQEYPLRIERK